MLYFTFIIELGAIYSNKRFNFYNILALINAVE